MSNRSEPERVETTRQEMDRKIREMQERESTPVRENDPSRIISPVDQASLGLTPQTDPPSVLLLTIQYKVAGRPGAVMMESAGKTDWSFQQGSNREQVIAMLGAITEWAKSVPGVEVEFLVKEEKGND